MATHGFVIQVSDGNGGSAQVSASVTVEAPPAKNHAPAMQPIAAQTVKEGSRVTIRPVATDIDGDTLTFSLLSGPSGATIDPKTGTVSWLALDGPASQKFVILADDGRGGRATATADLTVRDVAPTLTLSVPASGTVGMALTISFSSIDPGDDPVSAWRIDWGDGTVETLPATASGATHTYRKAGQFPIRLVLIDVDGKQTAREALTHIATPGLRVVDVQAANWGVRVRFNAAVDPTLPNPYTLPDNPQEPIDTMVLDARGDMVRGSLVYDRDRAGFVFLFSDGPLKAGTYTLRLVGNALGWRNAHDILDGDGDGVAGGIHETAFTLGGMDLSIRVEDAVAAPNQRLGAEGDGLELRLTQAGGVRSMIVEVVYDPARLDIDKLVAQLSGTQVHEISSTPAGNGELAGFLLKRFRVVFQTPPVPGTVHFANLAGRIAAGSGYGTASLGLSVSITEINGRATGMRPTDQALVLAAHRGDANADGDSDAADKTLFERLSAKRMEGLGAWRGIDPNLLADSAAKPGRESDGDGEPVSPGGFGKGNGRGPATGANAASGNAGSGGQGSGSIAGQLALWNDRSANRGRIDLSRMFGAGFTGKLSGYGKGGGTLIRACLVPEDYKPVPMANWLFELGFAPTTAEAQEMLDKHEPQDDLKAFEPTQPATTQGKLEGGGECSADGGPRAGVDSAAVADEAACKKADDAAAAGDESSRGSGALWLLAAARAFTGPRERTRKRSSWLA